MNPEPPHGADLTMSLEAILRELRHLSDRVSALEGKAAHAVPSAPSPASHAPSAAPRSPALSEEIILVIGAAAAAFLGKKAHVRQVRLIGSQPWAQQGRVTIQASHTLHGSTGRRSS